MAPRSAEAIAETMENDGWEEVESEAQIVFDTIGDVFIGKYLGMEVLTTGIHQAHFENEDGAFFTNAGADLRKKLEKVPVKAIVQIIYTDDLDTGQKSPMRVYNVKYRR